MAASFWPSPWSHWLSMPSHTRRISCRAGRGDGDELFEVAWVELSNTLGKGACNWAGKPQIEKPHVQLHQARHNQATAAGRLGSKAASLAEQQSKSATHLGAARVQQHVGHALDEAVLQGSQGPEGRSLSNLSNCVILQQQASTATHCLATTGQHAG